MQDRENEEIKEKEMIRKIGENARKVLEIIREKGEEKI